MKHAFALLGCNCITRLSIRCLSRWPLRGFKTRYLEATQAKLVLDDMWAWKYDLAWRNPALPIESDSWVGSGPDVLAVVFFKD